MIFALILLLFDAYLSSSLFLTALRDPAGGAWIGAIGLSLLQLVFLSQAWLFFVYFRSSSESKLRFEKPLQRFSFTAMGVLSFLFTLTLARDLLAGLSGLAGAHFPLYGAQPSLWISVLSVAAFSIGALNARFRITSPKVQVALAPLPPELAGLKIVQLSDVHLGTGPGTQHVREMVDRALELKPDLIALTGDIIDGNVAELEPELRELARLRAPLGVFYVIGNHECYWNHRESIEAMRRAGARVLENEGVELSARGHKIFVAGLNDPAIQHFNGEGPRVPVPPSDSKFNLILVHQPQVARRVLELAGHARYHLQLSGHTHGGQFIPWNWVVRFMYPIHKGLGHQRDLSVYVSTGSGYWGPPIRLGTDGEVTELTLAQG